LEAELEAIRHLLDVFKVQEELEEELKMTKLKLQESHDNLA